MKKISLLFIAFVLATACSKNDPAPVALQNTKVTATTITVPASMTNSTDDHAQAANILIGSANALTSFSASFGTVPAGATKSSTIKASNGRVNNTLGTSVTYTWTDNTGQSIGYQVTDDGTSYTWEFFYKAPGSDTWLKWLDANETKDGSVGYLKVYDFSGTDPKVIAVKFEWSKVGDVYTFKWTEGTDYFTLVYHISTKTGTIDSYVDGAHNAYYAWDGTGHGTWQTFNPVANGTW